MSGTVDDHAADIEAATPSMRQYFEIKRNEPNALLFFRMGDFYELFFEDAVKAAEALDIALTKRGMHRGQPIAMCGVPAHSSEHYLQRLVKAGFRVAICEQMEDPAAAKKRGSKSVVRREIVRTVTPGTVTEDALLDARCNNYLTAFATLREETALAWLDLSTGDFAVQPTTPAALAADLARLSPGEIVAPERTLEDAALRAMLEEAAPVMGLSSASFDSASAENRLMEAFRVSALEAFGTFSRVELSALGALIDYIAITQKGAAPHLNPPRRVSGEGAMRIDAATRRNLELSEALSGGRAGSLTASVDRTVTGAGARLLAERVAAPLTDPAAIGARHDSVALFREDAALSEAVRERLKRTPDLARALSRLSLGRGGPRDLSALRAGLTQAGALADLLHAIPSAPQEITEAVAALYGHEALVDEFTVALAPEPPLLARDGGFIAEGWSPPLDELRALSRDSRAVIRAMEGRLRAETGVATLKLASNRMLGFYIEVKAMDAETLKAEEHAGRFILRQGMANAARFTTADLAELSARIDNAAERALALELEIFEQLRQSALARAEGIAAAGRALSVLDVAAALGDLASEEGWTRPKVDASRAFMVKGGRHPVVEQALKKTGEPFIANDADFSDEEDGARLWLLTGPNMAGKSTFLRQNALIAVLAQAGCFVPAERAHIGVVDRLFSRVGASDDLARGRSTFMVEMVETAAILNQAGAGALVILDEIGRGTATFDGLSIAWATLEHLHDVNGCRGLFATHYHELTELAARLAHSRNAAMKVAEWKDDLVFTHEVEAGAATRSYGVQVAKKAGMPAATVARAREILTRLEQGDAEGGAARMKALIDDLPLFAAAAPRDEPKAGPDPLQEALNALDPDALTPRQALDALYRLKALKGGL